MSSLFCLKNIALVYIGYKVLGTVKDTSKEVKSASRAVKAVPDLARSLRLLRDDREDSLDPPESLSRGEVIPLESVG